MNYILEVASSDSKLGKTSNVKLLPTPTVYFENLNSLRFFAFAFVFASHSFESLGLHQTNILTKLLYVAGTLNGQSGLLGVRFFFVLSGFLITYLIFAEKYRNKGYFDIAAFYIRRTLRIWPLYFLAVLFGFLIYPKLVSHIGQINYVEQGNIFLQVLFLSNFDIIANTKPIGIVLANLWSLSVEEQFYLFWPFLFLASGFKNRIYLFAFILLIILSFLFQYLSRHDNWKINYFHSLACLGSLVIGSLVAYLAFFKRSFINYFKKLKLITISSVYIIGFAIIYLNFYINNDTFRIVYSLFTCLFFGFIIAEQNFSDNSILKLGRIKLADYLGRISFGLYIFHPIAILLVLLAYKGYTGILSAFLFKFILALGLSILFAHLSYTYFEIRFLKLKSKFERK